MPLSDHERRVLDEIECELHAADPQLASSLDSGAFRRARIGRRVKGAAVFACGLTMMLVAVVLTPTIVAVMLSVSILGFVVMFAGATYAIFGHPRLGGGPGQ